MSKQKKAFTLAELLVAITILIFVIALTIPIVKKTLPDPDKHMVRHAYYQINSVINSITNDPYLYPLGIFNNPRDYKAQNGDEFPKEEKFTRAFISRLNVKKIKKLMPNQEWNSSAEKSPSWKEVLSYDDTDTTKVREVAEGISKERTCILTNNRIYYCIPTMTYVAPPKGSADNDMKKYDRFYTHKSDFIEGKVLISVYLSDNHSIENGYYFTVNNKGKVDVLPSDNVTCFGQLDANSDTEDCSCNSNGDKYNQCKLYDYLVNTKITDD